ncbi:NAD-dependent deacetylase [Streptomyces sp. NPDC059740]|uniref:SIR2 family NAD-dependent protein deacylase n=1 Tax=Streptomyces sp. NPDC059740 TaxID=3346926 RepID=UPI0036526DB8
MSGTDAFPEPPGHVTRRAGALPEDGAEPAASPAGERPLVALLTGAGISTDSGIPDYRGPNGVWRRDPEAEKLVTYDLYMTDPGIRRRSWQMRRTSPALRARPNAAHEAVVELERAGVPVRVITQNVDGLHQRAGLPDRKVLELHGTARTVVCTVCDRRAPMARELERVEAGEADPRCPECGGIQKSATVMFGQQLDPQVLTAAVTVAKACDVFLAVGTSLSVQPAASLAGLAAEHGARLVIVNAEPTPYDEVADEVVREPIGTALPRLLREIAASGRQNG